MGENYFYEYGFDPSLKNFAEIIKQNSYGGKFYQTNTPVRRKTRAFMFRDINDFLYNTMNISTFPRTIGVQIASTILLAQSLEAFFNFLPIGEFGIRTYKQTNLFKVWGRLGVGAACLIPVLGIY